jgi:hypothetical protein
MTTKAPPTDVMTALGTVHDRISALASVLKELVVAECLQTTTLALSADGIATFDWSGGFASVAVTNTSAAAVTVTTDTPAAAAPTTGTGVGLCPPGKGTVYNMTGHTVTLYGTPGDRVTLSVFARPQPPAWG